ncbi:MAG: hypothetical protein WBS14_13115, partial [Rhodomicrobium sp.]
MRLRDHPMSQLGQVRDCIGLFEEDRIWILKPPWLAWLWKNAVTAACDPTRKYLGTPRHTRHAAELRVG